MVANGLVDYISLYTVSISAFILLYDDVCIQNGSSNIFVKYRINREPSRVVMNKSAHIVLPEAYRTCTQTEHQLTP